MRRWTEEQLEREMTREEFEKELEHLRAWLSKSPRRLRAWLYSVGQWSSGNH